MRSAESKIGRSEKRRDGSKDKRAKSHQNGEKKDDLKKKRKIPFDVFLLFYGNGTKLVVTHEQVEFPATSLIFLRNDGMLSTVPPRGRMRGREREKMSGFMPSF